MPIYIHWDDDEKTILRHDFDGEWTWGEYFELMRERNAHMSSVNHRVDVIANMKPGIMPTGFALTSAKTSLRSVPLITAYLSLLSMPLWTLCWIFSSSLIAKQR